MLSQMKAATVAVVVGVVAVVGRVCVAVVVVAL